MCRDGDEAIDRILAMATDAKSKVGLFDSEIRRCATDMSINEHAKWVEQVRAVDGACPATRVCRDPVVWWAWVCASWFPGVSLTGGGGHDGHRKAASQAGRHWAPCPRRRRR